MDISENAEQPEQILPNSDHNKYVISRVPFEDIVNKANPITVLIKRSWLYITNDNDEVKNSGEADEVAVRHDRHTNKSSKYSIHLQLQSLQSLHKEQQLQYWQTKHYLSQPEPRLAVAVQHALHTKKGHKFLIDDINITESESRRLLRSFLQSVREYHYLSEVAVEQPLHRKQTRRIQMVESMSRRKSDDKTMLQHKHQLQSKTLLFEFDKILSRCTPGLSTHSRTDSRGQ
jgi:hypothetical protein